MDAHEGDEGAAVASRKEHGTQLPPYRNLRYVCLVHWTIEKWHEWELRDRLRFAVRDELEGSFSCPLVHSHCALNDHFSARERPMFVFGCFAPSWLRPPLHDAVRPWERTFPCHCGAPTLVESQVHRLQQSACDQSATTRSPASPSQRLLQDRHTSHGSLVGLWSLDMCHGRLRAAGRAS